MRARTLTLLALGVAVVAACPASALGHGGEYWGPAGQVPPGSVEPSDPPPPPEGPPLDPCRSVLRTVLPSRTPDASARDRVAPLLRTVLADRTKEPDVRAAAAIALARMGDLSVVDDLKRLALDEDHLEGHGLHEAAALGLGLVGDGTPEIRDLLIRLVRGGVRDDDLSPSFAALSLGLLGGEGDTSGRAAAALLEAVARDERGRDIKPSCLVALGLLGEEWTIPELVAMARTARATAHDAVGLSDTEVAYAIAALGMIARPAAGDGALDAVEDIVRRTANPGLEARRAAALALGQIGARCERPARRRAASLLRGLAADGDADPQERLFALTALGRIGAAPGTPRIRSQIVAFLAESLRSGGEFAPAYAALALGAIGGAVSDEGDLAPEHDVGEALRTAFAAEKDVRKRGAFALASGLARDPLAADAVVAVLRDANEDPELRRLCEIAAEMLGVAGARRGTDVRADDELLAVAADETKPGQVRALAIAALGRIGHRRDGAIPAQFAAGLDRLPSFPAITTLLAIR